MIKNQLYPYIEKYFNELLYGFSKEQFDFGVMQGQIKFEKLNLRPYGVNQILDDKNYAVWLKAGFISKIYIGCSIMNFIGEKPLDAIIDGIDIILCPSYKWVIQNYGNYKHETFKEMREPYDPMDNNSMNIFERKVNIVDNSVLKSESIIEIFKDGSKISNLINALFRYCFKFYYMKNFLVNAKLTNIHIRFEDEELINYDGNIALGLKADSIEVSLSAEGSIKKDSLKINNLNIYWESIPKILIPIGFFIGSMAEEKLNEQYFKKLKDLTFQKFSYIEGTKFIVRNVNLNSKFGLLSVSNGKIDLFGSRENIYQIYTKCSLNELKINIYPELLNIYSNYRKFMLNYNVLEQVMDFKPMRKPYDSKNKIFKEMINKIEENRKIKNHNVLEKLFFHKRKMVIRDWLYYFYWCQKCKSSIYGKNVNFLRLEFNRFYGLCFNNWEALSQTQKKEKEDIEPQDKDKSLTNPDNVILNLNMLFIIKNININFHSSIKAEKDEYISLNFGEVNLKLNYNKKQFELQTNIKSINSIPVNPIIGESFKLSSGVQKKKQDSNISFNDKYMTLISNKKDSTRIFSLYNDEEKTGLSGLIKKFNPNYEKKIKIIDNAITKLGNKSKNQSAPMSEIDNNNTSLSNKLNKTNINSRNDNTQYFSLYNNDKQKQSLKTTSKYNNSHHLVKNASFAQQILSNYEEDPLIQKIELRKQKNEFNISQAINEYNNRKSRERNSIKTNIGTSNKVINVLYSKNQKNNDDISINTNIMSTGQNVPLNFFEITPNDSYSYNLKFIKNDKLSEYLSLKMGTIRFNIFSNYIEKYLNIFSYYQKFLKYPFMNSYKKIESGIKIEKQLYNLRKYIYDIVSKYPDKQKNEQIIAYIKFLKKEIDKAKQLDIESDNYEINYFISSLTQGFDIILDYDNLEFIYYDDNTKKVTGKGLIPSLDFRMRGDTNGFKLKCFDSEFELNNLNNIKFILSRVLMILREKIKMSNLLIEPYISKAKEELNIKIIKKRHEIELNHEKSKKLKLENIIHEIQNKFNKDKNNIQESSEIIKDNYDNDFVNYNNNNKIFFTNTKEEKKKEKEIKIKENFCTDNVKDDEELNDIGNDELNLGNNIKITKIPNKYYFNIFKKDPKTLDMDIDIKFDEQVNQYQTVQNENKNEKLIDIPPKNEILNENKKE